MGVVNADDGQGAQHIFQEFGRDSRIAKLARAQAGNQPHVGVCQIVFELVMWNVAQPMYLFSQLVSLGKGLNFLDIGGRCVWANEK